MSQKCNKHRTLKSFKRMYIKRINKKLKGLAKYSAILILRLLVRLLYIFPLKNNRIMFYSYKGSQYSCNPKYISETLMKQDEGKFEVIWSFVKPSKFGELKNHGIILVNYYSLRRLYYQVTSRIIVNNVGTYSWIPLRNEQEHINTWHAAYGYKVIGLGEKANSWLMKKTIQMSSEETSLITSPSKEFSDDIARIDLGYKGIILESGYARNDILFKYKKDNSHIRERVCSFYNIPLNSFIFLYAPTWRYNTKKTLPEIDYEEIRECLENKYRKNIVIIVRKHHLQRIKPSGDTVIDGSNYPDMQELLVAADTLVTDYSSSIWDYSIMEKPIYIFADDIEEYEKERGYHVPVYQWGFPVCEDSEALMYAIKEMTDTTAVDNSRNHRERAGDYENGTACKQICEWIYCHSINAS